MERHAGWFTKHGKPSPLLTALVLHRYRGHLYLASHPVWLQKLVFGMLAPLARLLGYGLVIEPER
jgi:hypothetical protein